MGASPETGTAAKPLRHVIRYQTETTAAAKPP